MFLHLSFLKFSLESFFFEAGWILEFFFLFFCCDLVHIFGIGLFALPPSLPPSLSLPLTLDSGFFLSLILGSEFVFFFKISNLFLKKKACDYLLTVTIIVIDIFCQITLKIDFYFERLVFLSLF